MFLVSPALQARSLPLAPPGKPHQEDSNQLFGHRKGNANTNIHVGHHRILGLPRFMGRNMRLVIFRENV